MDDVLHVGAPDLGGEGVLLVSWKLPRRQQMLQTKRQPRRPTASRCARTGQRLPGPLQRLARGRQPVPMCRRKIPLLLPRAPQPAPTGSQAPLPVLLQPLAPLHPRVPGLRAPRPPPPTDPDPAPPRHAPTREDRNADPAREYAPGSVDVSQTRATGPRRKTCAPPARHPPRRAPTLRATRRSSPTPLETLRVTRELHARGVREPLTLP